MIDSAHISTEEIMQDIQDTQHEIDTMTREIEGFRLLRDKMSYFRADARITGIKERKAFIEKLNGILSERGVSHD